MNLYLRFFNDETFAYNVDEALDFLRSIPEIEVDKRMEDELREYAASEVNYPKRYKVHARVYFIVIKTNAASMAEFKANRKKNEEEEDERPRENSFNKSALHLKDVRLGWYEGTLQYKRVQRNEQTGKYEYRDSILKVRCKASSGIECYDRMVDYLKERVDARSQFPSPKGKNFNWNYLGCCK